MLAPYFSSVAWTPEVKAAMFTEMDKDAGGSVCADEFYEWMIESAQLEVSAEGVTKMRQREERLKISTGDVPAHLMEIIDESGAKTIEQKVTHALHSGFDRTIADHFISCYLLLKEWGCDDDVCVAGLLHASYRRGDGLQAVKPSEMRPVWQEKLGAGAEELIYLFPSAHKTAYASDGLLHAPLGSTISFPDLLDDGKTITIDDKQRAALAELEVVNRCRPAAARATAAAFSPPVRVRTQPRPKLPLQRRPGAEPVAVLSARDDHAAALGGRGGDDQDVPTACLLRRRGLLRHRQVARGALRRGGARRQVAEAHRDVQAGRPVLRHREDFAVVCRRGRLHGRRVRRVRVLREEVGWGRRRNVNRAERW